MSLIDFVKAAGKSLGFGKDETPDAEAIRKEVESHGLDTSKIDIEVKGDEIEARGEAASQELREKVIVAMGNILGVAGVRDKITTKDRAQISAFHEVKKGETLWAIASKHYGNGTKYQTIFEANRPMLSDPDKIYPGQILRIPAAKG